MALTISPLAGRLSLLLVFICGVLSACAEPDTSQHASGGHQPTATQRDQSFEKSLLKKLITAKSGDVIEIPEGKFNITRALSLKDDGVTIRGQGNEKSVLSFKHQIQGAEGLIVTGNNVVLEGFAVEDAKGDAIKINQCENLIVRDVRTEWTNGPDRDNGAYGLYPVQCSGVLIDGAIAIGASDAGIYVGQSNGVIVKNSSAEYNVAGIEIENTINADVFDNIATNNTGGILVFNMPNIAQAGARTRVFNNQVFANNTSNFAPPGTAVSSVPAGSGIVINSNDEVEIFNNKIANNDTANIIISSYFSTTYSDSATSDAFDAYPEAIYIYDNQYEGGGSSPDGFELKALKLAQYGLTGRLPDVLWDGYYNKELSAGDGGLPSDKAICIANPEVVMLNVDAPNKFENVNQNMASHRCHLEKLPEVKLSFLAREV